MVELEKLLKGVGAGIGMIIDSVMGMSPLRRQLQYEENKFWPNMLNTPENYAKIRKLGYINEEYYNKKMLELGYGFDEAVQYHNLEETPLSAGEYLKYLWRTDGEYTEYIARMRKIGYMSDDAEMYQEANRYLPGPQDLIRFSVRDVYNQNIVDTYQYDFGKENLPVSEAKKVGMDAETLLSYWRAHWILPSVGQGFEMMHRGVIDPEELPVLLKISDIAPYWVDKLIKISYSPYSRVDARRMEILGVLEDGEFVQSMKDIGYTDEKAEKLFDWVKLQKVNDERDLTRSMILNALKQEEITREKALEYVESLGYDSEESELIISIDEENRRVKESNKMIKHLIDRFRYGNITEEELKASLITNKVNAIRLPYEIEKAIRLKEGEQKQPTKSDLTKFYNAGFIEADIFRERLVRIGYSYEDAEMYLKLEGAS